MIRTRAQASNTLAALQVKTPPADLRSWVGGRDEEIFELIGKTVALNLFDAVEPLRILNSAGARILDFGCGCARVSRYFRALYPDAIFYGVDPDPTGIQWCVENIRDVGTFIQSQTRPPLMFDEPFDFIYAISVFTHLPEDIQFQWLEELCRITKSGGYLVLTTHGETIAQLDSSISEQAKLELKSNGFWYRDNRNNLIGADYYDAVWHTKEYVQKNWGKFFKIVDHIDRGINNHQDLILCKKE